ncbi:MAG: NAD(P)H-dependent oxidoreductase [Spirochaetales bacterium]|nr:NAD(P)H-dependent oxidoreductase [Spirochaetales bacterium]
MKITIIHGQSHKGSTYHIAHSLAEQIDGQITEFFLPRDFDKFCVGCTTCFTKGETKCPHYEALAPITAALLAADVIILSSPVYVFHATGAMKALLDHYGYQWMAHRPNESMFGKQGVCVATAAGAGIGSTLKDMADSLFFWGVAKQYKLGFAVSAVSWDAVKDKRKSVITRRITSLSAKIRRRNGKVKPGFKTRAFFGLMRMIQRNGWNEADVRYWEEKGWTKNKRPWKNR